MGHRLLHGCYYRYYERTGEGRNFRKEKGKEKGEFDNKLRRS